MCKVSTVVLKRYPQGMPDPKLDFETIETTADPPKAQKAGEVVLQNLVLSVDPYMRGRMIPRADSYVSSFELGEPLNGFCVARVKDSQNKLYPVGTIVSGILPWITEFVINLEPEKAAAMFIRPIPTDLASTLR